MNEKPAWPGRRPELRPRARVFSVPRPAAGARSHARFLVAGLVAGVAVLAGAPAAAQSVALTGTMGDRALLVIDGAAPQVVASGETRQGVTLISSGGQTAVVEIRGQRQSLRVGESPVSVAAQNGSGGGRRVVLHAGSGGHFYGTAMLNGMTVPFMVDTGASDVVLGAAQAEQIGLSFRSGQRQMVVTANGLVPAYRVPLDSVRVGEVEIFNVEASVVPAGMPAVLLGNSFLSRFQMKQENDQLLLEKRY